MRAISSLIFILSGSLFAQAADVPAFEVSTIKFAAPGVRGFSIRPMPGRIVASNSTLKLLIAEAWHVYDFQISGGPKWLDSDRFDVEAKAPDGTNPPKEQLRLMFRKVLEDRFSLAFHDETKDLPVYVLEPAKSGSKLQPSKDKDGPPQFRVFQRRQITAQRAPLSLLTETLSQLAGRPVVDQTGLDGVFDYKLEWTPDEVQVRSDETSAAPAEENAPSLTSALQQQLGLRLRAQKSPVKILVIDRAAKPSTN